MHSDIRGESREILSDNRAWHVLMSYTTSQNKFQNPQSYFFKIITFVSRFGGATRGRARVRARVRSLRALAPRARS